MHHQTPRDRPPCASFSSGLKCGKLHDSVRKGSVNDSSLILFGMVNTRNLRVDPSPQSHGFFVHLNIIGERRVAGASPCSCCISIVNTSPVHRFNNVRKQESHFSAWLHGTPVPIIQEARRPHPRSVRCPNWTYAQQHSTDGKRACTR